MIQRIQSIYLALIAVFMSVTTFLPIIEVVYTDGISHSMTLLRLGTYSFLPDFTAPALSLIIGLMALYTIFLYKKRRLQIQLCGWMLALILLLYISIFYSYFELTATMDENVSFFPEITIAFPLIALILDCVSIAGIRKDERIVGTLSRLR